MAELRIVEHYASVQGEGPRVGMPTQFIRFAGCNMRCPGWPCDTEHAINPSIFMTNSYKAQTETVMGDVIAKPGENICLTGGEPFIQPLIGLQALTEALSEAQYSIECFTNGSVEIPVWGWQHMSFMMDWKLGGSGEADNFVAERYANALRLRRQDGIKFVITSTADFLEAISRWDELKELVTAQFWYAPAWDKVEPAWLIEQVLKNNLPWRLNIQTHKYIWPADKRGV